MDFTVESENCILHGSRTGYGPVLLLIHGIACDGSHFSKAVKYLSKNYSVVTYDRRGYSGSIAEKGASYSVEAQARDALRIMDLIGCRQACVAASSAGGIVALELAQSYPGRVQKLFLHETPIAPNADIQAQLDSWHAELKQTRETHNIAKSMALLLKAMGGYDKESEPVPREQQAKNMDNMKVFLEHEMDEFLIYAEKRKKIYLPMPCVVSSGEMDRDGLFSRYMPEVAKFLGCHYLMAPGYHNLAWDLPFSYATLLEGALCSMD